MGIVVYSLLWVMQDVYIINRNGLHYIEARPIIAKLESLLGPF